MWDWFIGILTVALGSLAGVFGDWGIAIIVLTVIIRLLLLPLSIRQIKSTARMSQLTPKIQEIQTRYADDPVKQQEALTKIYAEGGVSPMGGCLPLILQMPVFFALFAVLRNITSEASFLNILPVLRMSASEMVGANGIVPAAAYIVLDVLFGVLTFVPMLLTATGDEEQKRTTLSTGGIMSVMMVWMGWRLPAGVILYYVVSNAWAAVQQLVIGQRVRADIEAEEAAADIYDEVQVNVVRKQKKARPRKKS